MCVTVCVPVCEHMCVCAWCGHVCEHVCTCVCAPVCEHMCVRLVWTCVNTRVCMCVRAGLCTLHVLAVLASRGVLAGPGTAPCEGLLRPPSPLSLPWLDWLQGSLTCGSRPSLASSVPCAWPGLCPVKTCGPGGALPRGLKGPGLSRQVGPLGRSHLQPRSPGSHLNRLQLCRAHPPGGRI